MSKTRHSNLIKFFFTLLFLVSTQLVLSQENEKVTLKLYLSTLENTYDVKFSFVDQDVQDILITKPNFNKLHLILSALENQTKLKIEKLNDRYYTLTKKPLVTICANVFDNYEENTIPGATIEILGSEDVIITNTDGNFTLVDVPRTALLKIRYLGYTTKYISVEEIVNKGECPTILLSQNLEELEEVVVYQFLTSGLVKQADASITLNTSELGILPGLIEPDILQSVQALPGVKSIDETVSDINVRGGTNDQNLILWNGIKMYQSGHFFGLISAFNPYLTDKATLYKNGTPSKYGDGVSSVISLETKNDIEDSFFGGAGLNLISGDVYGQFNITDKVAFQFSTRRSITDFLNTPTYDSFIERVFQDSEIQNLQNQTIDENFDRDLNFLFYDFTGKLLYDINENQKLRINFINIANDLEYVETNLDANETSQSFLDQTNTSIGLQLHSNWTDRFSTHANIYYSNYNLNAESFFPNLIQQLQQTNNIEENAIKLNSTFLISNTLNWQNGYQFIETGIRNFTSITEPNFSSEIKGVIRINAPYTQLTYKTLDKKIIVDGGLRLNFIENLPSFGASFKEFILEPRLNINYRLTENLRVQLLGEFKSQTTNQIVDLEQNFLGIEKRRWILSDNNELPITESKQASIGINYDKNSLYIGLEGFYKEVEGISTRTQGFQNENQFNGEIGSYQIKGLEFLINKKGANYSSWLSYTYNKNDYTFDSIIPSTFPNNLDISHNLTLASTYSIKNLTLGATINYRTGRPFTEPLEGDLALDTSFFPNRINFQAPNSSRLPEFFRTDASINYNFNINSSIKASTGFSIINLTNRRNILNQYYRVTENNEIETVLNSSLGATPNLNFRIRF